MKNFSKITSSELYQKYLDITFRKFVFLGNKFNPETEEGKAILNLKWNTVFTSITDESKISSIEKLINNNARNSVTISCENLESKQDEERLLSTKSIVDSKELKIIQLFTSAQIKNLSKKRLAQRIMENIAVPFLMESGFIVFIGFDAEDEFQSDDFIYSFDKLGEKKEPCVFVFECNETFEKELTENTERKWISFEEKNFYEFSKNEFEIDFSRPIYDYYDDSDYDDDNEIRFFVNNENKYINIEHVKGINSFSTFLNYDVMFPKSIDKRERRKYFKVFMKNSPVEPVWFGYKEKYYLKRDFQDELLTKTKCSLENPGKLGDRPILIHGQSGSGKTIALRLLAYKIFHEKKYPVFFSEQFK